MRQIIPVPESDQLHHQVQFYGAADQPNTDLLRIDGVCVRDASDLPADFLASREKGLQVLCQQEVVQGGVRGVQGEVSRLPLG